MSSISPNGVRRIYAVLSHLASCDGHVHPNERHYLDTFAATYEIDRAEAARIERRSVRGRGLSVGRRAEERALLLEGIVQVVAADGVLAEAERVRAEELAGLLDLAPQTLVGMLQARIESRGARATGDDPDPRGLGADARLRVYGALCAFAAADGTVQAEEANWLTRYAEAYGIGADAARAAESRARVGDIQLWPDDEEKLELLRGMIDLCGADGSLSMEERRAIAALSKDVGIELDLLEQELVARVPPPEGTEDPPVVELMQEPLWFRAVMEGGPEAGASGPEFLLTMVAVVVAVTVPFTGLAGGVFGFVVGLLGSAVVINLLRPTFFERYRAQKLAPYQRSSSEFELVWLRDWDYVTRQRVGARQATRRRALEARSRIVTGGGLVLGFLLLVTGASVPVLLLAGSGIAVASMITNPQTLPK